MRGKQYRATSTSVRVGITPADAGKTNGAQQEINHFQDHPRGCGENDPYLHVTACAWGSPPRMRGKRNGGLIMRILNRITPADAGKTVSGVNGINDN